LIGVVANSLFAGGSAGLTGAADLEPRLCPQQKQEELDDIPKTIMMAKIPPLTYGNQLKTYINEAK
jgi:hypothetical protein